MPFTSTRRSALGSTDTRGFTFHFTPSSASWLNAVEGFFAKLAKRQLRRGVFGSRVIVPTAIRRFIAESNGDPKPFAWTADPDQIVQAAKHGHQALDSHHYSLPTDRRATILILTHCWGLLVCFERCSESDLGETPCPSK
jgi:hypothetical protein